jgi:hypothetical protein
MLGFTSFCVQSHPREATLWWVYLWVYSVFELGVFSEEGDLKHCGAYRYGDKKSQVEGKSL